MECQCSARKARSCHQPAIWPAIKVSTITFLFLPSPSCRQLTPSLLSVLVVLYDFGSNARSSVFFVLPMKREQERERETEGPRSCGSCFVDRGVGERKGGQRKQAVPPPSGENAASHGARLYVGPTTDIPAVMTNIAECVHQSVRSLVCSAWDGQIGVCVYTRVCVYVCEFVCVRAHLLVVCTCACACLYVCVCVGEEECLFTPTTFCRLSRSGGGEFSMPTGGREGYRETSSTCMPACRR